MRAVGFYLLYGIIWTTSLLPLKVLFLFSDLLYILVFYVIKYRRKVVHENIAKSFPEKGQAERLKIEKEFYRHFCDSFFEWTYSIHATKEQMMRHFQFHNPEEINQLYTSGKSVVAVLGHYGNWEWLNILPQYIPYEVWAIHKPLHNRFFNDFINGLRSKFGVKMVDTKNAFRTMLKQQRSGHQTFTYFLADQSPPRSQIQHYTQFLNQRTPVYLGAEVIAKKLNMAVVFLDIRKIKRGYYKLFASVLYTETQAAPEFAITERHVAKLEEVIREAPAWWLWSHRRWKYSQQQDGQQT